MKKCLLPVWMVLMLCFASTANAQLRFGIKGGANIATVKFDKDILATENITGFHIGPMFEYMPKIGLGVDIALLYSQKGFFIKGIDKTFDKSYINSYIEVPLNLKMKIGIPVISPYFAAGPYVSFLVGGDKEFASLFEYGGDIVGQIKTKSFGAGMNFTAGVEVLKHLQVGLTYNWGLTDYFDGFDTSAVSSYIGRPHTWMISATVIF